MKKFLAFTLCMVLLVATFCVLTNGAEKPAGTKELTQLTAIPTGQDIISVGLMAPNIYSLYTFGPDTIDEANQYELSRYLKYGVSILGVSGLERSISGAVDGYWTTGNTGSVLENASAKQYGAFSWYNNGKLYNHLGETDQKDSIYQVVMTLNFGKPASLNSFGYAAPGLNNAFQAADIYVSSNGEDWTMVGYYDRPTTRMNGSDLTQIPGADCPNDATGKGGTGFILFDLGNVEAQFLRVCATANAGKTTPVDPTDYNAYSNSSTEKSAFRELVVFGKKLDKPSNVTATEKAEQNTTEAAATTTSTPISQIPVKPKETTAEATTEAATTAAATTKAATTAATEEKSGCGSYLGTSAIVMLVATAGTAVVATGRRKRK